MSATAKLVLGAVALALVGIATIAAGLVVNRVPLTAAPGLLPRLKIYLGSNVAETGRGSALPELAARYVPGEPREHLDAVAGDMEDLGWRSIRVDPAAGEVRAEVVSALWRFTDDVQVRLVSAGDGRTEVRIRSASRVGRGDLGANLRHVLDLAHALGARPAQ